MFYTVTISHTQRFQFSFCYYPGSLNFIFTFVFCFQSILNAMFLSTQFNSFLISITLFVCLIWDVLII